MTSGHSVAQQASPKAPVEASRTQVSHVQVEVESVNGEAVGDEEQPADPSTYPSSHIAQVSSVGRFPQATVWTDSISYDGSTFNPSSVYRYTMYSS